MKARVCPVPGCVGVVAPTRAFCHLHWNYIPKHLRDAISIQWRRGQFDTVPPSDRFNRAVQVAVRWIEDQRGQRDAG